MRIKQLSMPVKQAIIKLKNEKKTIRDIAETLGVSKSTVWNIIKKQERTGALSNAKPSGRPRKTTVVDDEKILSIVTKKPFSTAEQIKSTLQDVGVDVSKSTIRRRLHQNNYRWLTTRYKPQGIMPSHSEDQSGMSMLQEQVRREISQRMQTRFSSIFESEKMDLEDLLSIAHQELAQAKATSNHVSVPQELVCSLQELICRLRQSMQSAAEAPSNPADTETVIQNNSPSPK